MNGEEDISHLQMKCGLSAIDILKLLSLRYNLKASAISRLLNKYLVKIKNRRELCKERFIHIIRQIRLPRAPTYPQK